MAVNSFFPSNEADQIAWLTNYAAKLPVNGAICDISGDEITRTQTDITYQLWLLKDYRPAVRRDTAETNTFIALMLNGGNSGNGDSSAHPSPSTFPAPPPIPAPGILKRLFSQVARIKASTHYTEDIGRNLNILSTVVRVDHPIPEFNAAVELGAEGSRVRIDFKKYGHDGIWIESRINSSDWAFLAIDTIKPYLDERPLSVANTHEVREYRMRWWDKSQPHGEWSASQKVVVGAV